MCWTPTGFSLALNPRRVNTMLGIKGTGRYYYLFLEHFVEGGDMYKTTMICLFSIVFLFIASISHAIPPNTVIIYEHHNFQGKSLTVSPVTEKAANALHSLKGTGLHDEMSSYRYNLPEGVEFIFYEHSDGNGRAIRLSGTSEHSDTKRNNFKDCASAWKWFYKNIPSDTVIFYEHKNYGGKVVTASGATKQDEDKYHSLKGSGVHDESSSIRWNIPPGKRVMLYVHSDGDGNAYELNGKGDDPDTHDNGLGDNISSWRWFADKLPINTAELYKHSHFGGKAIKITPVTRYPENRLNSLKGTGLHDEITSIRWNLEKGIVFALYQDDQITNRNMWLTNEGEIRKLDPSKSTFLGVTFSVGTSGEDASAGPVIRPEDAPGYNDCFSTWKWMRRD